MKNTFIFYKSFFYQSPFIQSCDIPYQYDRLNYRKSSKYPNDRFIVYIYIYIEVSNHLTQTITTNTAAPAANFNASPTSGLIPLHITFTDALVPGANPIFNWQWDFENTSLNIGVNHA